MTLLEQVDAESLRCLERYERAVLTKQKRALRGLAKAQT